jgi:glycogen synthase
MISNQPPRRILMTTDAVGGVWHYSLELCCGYAPLGIEVVLATMGPPPSPAQRAAAMALPNVMLCESEFLLEWMPEPWADVAQAGEWLLGLEARYAPDLVHLNGYAHGALAWRAPVLIVAHSCVLSWWLAVRCEEAPVDWMRYREAVRAGLQAASAVIAPSRTMLASLVRNYGALPRSEVIPNGRDAAEFPAMAKQRSVLAVCRLWDEAKNAALLATAAPRLDWPVVLVGDATPPAGMAPRPRLDNVLLTGPQTPAELRQHFGEAGIYALPARYEPFGLSVLEAALAGCALVLGDICSLRENWEGAADFVAPDDVDGWTRTINALASDDARRQQLAQLAQLRARTFSRERMIAAYLETMARCRATNRAEVREEATA